MKTAVQNTYATFEPQGYISAANVSSFQSQLAHAVKQQSDAPLLIDMSGVEFLDSAGLMALVSAFRMAQELERRFSLCSLAPSVRMIFELTGLDRAFEVFDDRSTFESAIS